MEDNYGGGSSDKGTDDSKKGTYGGESPGKCGDWYAWHDHMPGSPKTLYVTGKCTFPTPGFTVELKPAVPQGINPKIYLLEKTVTPPSGPEPDVVTTIDVRYEEQTDTEYDQVTILPDGVTVDVVHTQ
jgi:hypothetical protein